MKSEKTEVSNQPIVNMCNCDCRLTDSCTKNIDQVRVQGSGEISNMDLLTITKQEDRIGEDHPVTKSNMWNINRNSSSSRMISLKDTTTNQSHRWRRSSESVTVDSSKFSTNQSDQKRRRSSHKVLPRIPVITIGLLVVIVLLASEMERTGVEAAAVLRRRSTSNGGGNIWEQPCGNGRYHEKPDNNKNHNKKQATHIKDVFHQTKRLLTTLDNRENKSQWVDGDWGHELTNFEFPDISHFTFRKVHLALQQYMAIFQKFSKIENGSERRQELQGTFQTMQRETRSLLCLIESVINGTRQANRNRVVATGGGKPRGFSESAGSALKAKRPAYRYYTQQVMERKLKGLTDELTEDKLLNIAKVVFFNYKEFVATVSAKAKLRVERIEKRKAAAAVGKGNGALAARNKVNQGGGGSVEKNTIQNNNKTPLISDSVTKRPSEGVLRRNKNKNKNNNNNNNNNNKLNKQRKRMQNKKLRQMEGRRKERRD